jgi:amino acid permease
MIKNLKLTLLSLSSLFAVAVPVVAATSVSAAVSQSELNDAACSGTTGELQANHTIANCNKSEDSFNKYTKLIVDLLSVIVGFVAVVMLIIGGFRYITSGGNSENVTKAKNTIIYALIGLVIVAVAQIVVQFVLHKADTGTSG